MQWVAIIVLSVMLSSPFGEATATAVDEGEQGLDVVVTVEMDQVFEAVLVRPFSSFEELDPTALVAREDGVWGAVVTVPTAENWSVVFDALRADGTWERSDVTDLVAMGVDPIVVGAEPEAPAESASIDSSTWWLVGGAVLGIAALGALAWWAFMPARREDEPETSSTDEQVDTST